MMEGQLQALQISFITLGGQGLTDFLYRWLNPRRCQKVGPPVLARGLIRDQVLYNAPVARGNGFILDGYPTRVLSLKELPQQTFPGMFSPLSAVFDAQQDMLVVFNFVVPDQDEALGRLKFQKTFAFIQRTSSLGDVSEEAVQKKEDLSGLITQIF